MTEAEKKAHKEKQEKLAALKKKGGIVKFFKSLMGKFAMAVLKDGVEISYEGDLAKGTICYVEVEGAEVPLSEGTHELGGEMEGKSIVVDATGTVQEIIDAAATEEEEQNEEEQMNEFAEVTANEFKRIEDSFKKQFDAQAKENERLQKLIEKLAADFVAGKLTKESLAKTLDASKPDKTSKLA